MVQTLGLLVISSLFMDRDSLYGSTSMLSNLVLVTKISIGSIAWKSLILVVVLQIRSRSWKA